MNLDRTIHIAVRDFVAPLDKAGDLNQMPTYAPAGGMRQVAQQIHAEFQLKNQSLSKGYQKEVYLSASFAVEVAAQGTLQFVVSGRADGVFENSSTMVLEEIKTSTHPYALMHALLHNADHPYILEAKMYGWLLKKSQESRPICLKIALVNVFDPEDVQALEIDTQEQEFNLESFEQWVLQRARDLFEQRLRQQSRQEQRYREGVLLRFPFENLRQGQAELVKLVQNCIDTHQPLMLQAPTGLGKTAGVLFPHVKSALQSGKQVFYVTPKNSQHELALEAISRMRAMGRDVRGVVITAKEKSCLKDEMICDAKYCEFAAGYYDKLRNTQVLDELAAAGCVDFALLQENALKYKVCPFELSLDFTAHCDVIVCDYNYVFSPQAALVRYFEDDARNHMVHLVIDEAHNLFSRGMELFSSSLSFAELEAFKGEAESRISAMAQQKGLEFKKCQRLLEKVVKQAMDALQDASQRAQTSGFQEFARFKESRVVVPNPDLFFKVERALGRLMQQYLQLQEYFSQSDPLHRFFRKWNDFSAIMRLGGNEFIYTWQETAEGGALFCTCCDASRFLAPKINSVASVTAFSATLKPFHFYAQMSGFSTENVVFHEFESPFPNENRKLMIIPQVSTAFKDRQHNYAKVAQIVEKIVSLKRGNYFVFFPSYQFLQAVSSLISLPSCRIYEQASGMSVQDTLLIIQKMQQKNKNVVVLAVQGGALAEGIDLPGEDVIGAIVVGPSLPSVSLERECIRAYYEKKYGRGFDYAYVYPAMTRVVQAAGRVIRSPQDKGLIVLCDKRFLLKNYWEVMPQYWFDKGPMDCVSNSILKDVADFWGDS